MATEAFLRTQIRKLLNESKKFSTIGGIRFEGLVGNPGWLSTEMTPRVETDPLGLHKELGSPDFGDGKNIESIGSYFKKLFQNNQIMSEAGNISFYKDENLWGVKPGKGISPSFLAKLMWFSLKASSAALATEPSANVVIKVVSNGVSISPMTIKSPKSKKPEAPVAPAPTKKPIES